MGELLAQVANQGVDVWHAGPFAAFVEEEVVRWLCDLVGYGPTSFGLLTSGGVMANFMAMALAHVHLRAAGCDARPWRPRTGARVYTSDQTHSRSPRALDEPGFCRDPRRPAGRALPPTRRLSGGADRADRGGAAPGGRRSRGGLDQHRIRGPGRGAGRLARDEGLWLHVDAAYGGAARLSDRDRGRVPGLHLADSVTIDPHKWFFQAYDVGGLLVRDGAHLRQVFDRTPEYYHGGETPTGDPAGEGDAGHQDAHAGQLNFYKLGFEGTRRWRALKLWTSWKHLGTSGLGRLIEANDDVAAHLARRCSQADDLEALPAEPELSVVCFRHLPGGAEVAHAMPKAELDAHQDRLAAALEASGDGWLSTTTLRGATWLRAGVVNYLTTEADIDRLLATLRRLAVAQP
jgi:glutamate/tyrosine decarboxylase-like PLP-dependent enzyme